MQLTLKGVNSELLGWDFVIVEENGFRFDCRDYCSRVWRLFPNESYLEALTRIQALILKYGDAAYAFSDQEVEELSHSKNPGTPGDNVERDSKSR